MGKHYLFLVLATLLCTGFAYAQTKQVSGTVTDSAGNRLANVTVQLRNGKTGTKTDESGSFSFPVPLNNPNILVSYVGYEPQQVSVANNASVRVILLPLRANMEEVVVTALGINRDRRTLGYATQTIKNDAIADKGDVSLLNALQGKIAGADITAAGGAAGASTAILLRGISSFTGSQSPLMVLDGVPISDAVDESTIGLYTNQSPNRGIDLNINNIESVNVLSGPAAAALYGSRASHGAIMITTKKGSGQRGKVNVVLNTTYTRQNVFGYPELQNTFGQGANGIFSAITTNSLGPAFSATPNVANTLIVGATPQYVNGVTYTAGQVIPNKAFPNNMMSYFRTGTVLENNLSINAGDAQNYYGITLGHSQQDGIIPNSEFNRKSVSFSGSTYFTDKLNVKAAASYFSSLQLGISQGTNTAYGAYASAIRIPRNIDVDYYKQNYTTAGGYNNWFIPNVYNTTLQDSASAADNPFFGAYKNPIRSDVSRFQGNLTINYDITSWLNAGYRLGVDTYTDRRKRTIVIGSSQTVRSVFSGAAGSATGGIMEDVFYNNEINGDLMITAKRSGLFTRGLNATFLLGHGVNQRRYQQVNQTGYGLTVPDFYNISNATNLSLTGEYTSLRRLWGLYGQISLAYNNYLFLELTGRHDHSSTLPLSKNAFFYPSISTSFVLTDAFKIKSDLLSFAKIRAAFARVGVDAPVYVLDNRFVSASAGNNVSSYSFPFGSVAGFNASNVLGNKELTPEFSSTLDLGINLGLFRNRLNIDATVYKSKSTDQIVSVGLPGSSGYARRLVNIGEMTNKGLELTVNGTIVKRKNFSWSATGTFSFNRNKVTAIAPGVTSFGFGGFNYSGLTPTIAVGEPYGVIRGSRFVQNDKGEKLIDSTTGLFLNYETGVTVLDPNRDWIAGLTNTFNYKNFSLSFLVDHKQGGQFLSFTASTLRSAGALKITEDREQPFILPGVIDMGNGKYRPNNIQINGQLFYNAAWGASTGASTSNEYAVVDATTVRLREVSLSYDLKASVLHARWFKNMRLTVFGRNLFFYAPNSLMDPELSTQGAGIASGFVRGLELGSAPNTRNIGASLRITF
jgi:TonB-linked SusC/RagA family outer membrane protein